MSIIDTIKSDLATAMKAGEKERVGTLRMVLSELQKAAKEGSDDELAVLRRERKRRAEAERAYRDAGREDLAAGEASEATLISAYLPAELDDAQLAQIVAHAELIGAATPLTAVVRDLYEEFAADGEGGSDPGKLVLYLQQKARAQSA